MPIALVETQLQTEDPGAIFARLTELEHVLPDIAQQYYRLVLIVGPVGSGKTPLLKSFCRRRNVPYLNLNLTLIQRLLDLTVKQRPLRVRRLLAEILDEQPGDTIVVPLDVDRMPSLALWRTSTTILYNLAISVAAML